MNRVIGALLAAARRLRGWAGRHPRIRPFLGFLRRHWAETVAVVSLVALVAAVNPPRLLSVFGHAQLRFALLMLPVVIVMYVLRGLAWWFALRCIGVHIGVLRTLTVEFAGQVMVFLPMGDLARVAMLRGTDDERGAGAVTGTVAFQELMFMMLLGFGVLPRVFVNPGVTALVVLMVIAHVGIFTILSWQPAYARARRFAERLRILRRFDRQLRELRPAFVELWDLRAAAPIVALQAASAFLSFLLFFLALQALGVSHITLLMSTFILSLSYLLAGLSLIPGGLGAFEGLLTILLATNGVSPAAGAAAGLLYRGYNDVLVALIGAPFAIRVRHLSRERKRRRGRRRESRPSRARA